MATTAKTTDSEDEDLSAQIRRLRQELEALIDRTSPAVADAVRHAGDAARHAGDVARGQVDALSGHVRAEPLTSVLIAAAIGYVVGRLTR